MKESSLTPFCQGELEDTISYNQKWQWVEFHVYFWHLSSFLDPFTPKYAFIFEKTMFYMT